MIEVTIHIFPIQKSSLLTLKWEDLSKTSLQPKSKSRKFKSLRTMINRERNLTYRDLIAL
jgi:hypothetical protein